MSIPQLQARTDNQYWERMITFIAIKKVDATHMPHPSYKWTSFTILIHTDYSAKNSQE